MTLAILIPVALVFYVALVVWVLKRFRSTVFGDSNSSVASTASSTLAHSVKRILDVVLWLGIIVIAALPPLFAVMAISQSGNPGWGVDIQVFSGFYIDANALPGVELVGLRNPEVHGEASIQIDTSSLYAWYLFGAISLVTSIAALYCVVQLRTLVCALNNGVFFATDSPNCIKRIGTVVIAWCLLSPLVQYFGWGSVIQDVSSSSAGLQLYPAFEIDIVGIVVGLLLLLLARILQEADEMHREQELTI